MVVMALFPSKNSAITNIDIYIVEHYIVQHCCLNRVQKTKLGYNTEITIAENSTKI